MRERVAEIIIAEGGYFNVAYNSAHKIMSLLIEAGWIPPGEGVRLDMMVDGMFKCNEHQRECRQRAFRPNVCQLIPCEYLRPATVADLTKEG